MAPSSRTGAIRTPRRGIVLWLMLAVSVATGGLVGALLLMVLGPPRTTEGWLWTSALIALGGTTAYVVLSIGRRTSDGFAAGTEQADRQRGDRFEATGRRAGRAVGHGLARLSRRDEVASPSSSPSTDSNPRPTLDDAARSLGRMVGRRLDARRRT